MTDQAEFGGFGDADAVRSGGDDAKLTFPFLVLEQVRRIAKAGSVEFRGGYRELVSTNPDVYRYVPSTTETFSESVLTLANMLSGYFDDDMKACFSSFEEALSKKKAHLKEWSEETGNKYPERIEDFFRSELSRVLFADLCKFLKRINFMQGSGVEEGLLDDR